MTKQRSNNPCDAISLGKKFTIGLVFAAIGPAVAAILSVVKGCIGHGCPIGSPEYWNSAQGVLAVSYVLGAVPSLITVVLSAALLGRLRASWLAVTTSALIGGVCSASYYAFWPLLRGEALEGLLTHGSDMLVQIGLLGLGASLLCSLMVVTFIRPMFVRAVHS